MIIIDRFEGSFALLECNGKMKSIERSLIEDGASEGDVLVFVDGKYRVDTFETDKRKKRAEALFERFKSRN